MNENTHVLFWHEKDGGGRETIIAIKTSRVSAVRTKTPKYKAETKKSENFETMKKSHLRGFAFTQLLIM